MPVYKFLTNSDINCAPGMAMDLSFFGFKNEYSSRNVKCIYFWPENFLKMTIDYKSAVPCSAK